MIDFTTKQLAFVARMGPAFDIKEIAAAHAALDLCDVPRRLNDKQLTLSERILYLNNLLVDARSKAGGKHIVILSKSESESLIPEEYRILEVKS